jgi:ribosomal protein L32
VTTTAASRHRWGEPDRTDPRLTLRICAKCGMRKLTHHGNMQSWVTYASRDGLAFHGENTPKCFGSDNAQELIDAQSS